MIDKERGFTLLELMIAILLFSMISTAAYKLFMSVTTAQEVTESVFEDLDVIQRAKLIIEKDLFQQAPRPVRDEFGDRQPAVISPTTAGSLIEFTRTGWRNPTKDLRSDMQRVAYRIENGHLIRSYWLMLDRAPDPVKVDQVLLSKVEQVRFRFLDEKKRWHTRWPPEKQSSPSVDQTEQTLTPVMPLGIEMTITHRTFGPFVVVLPLLDYKESEPQSDQKVQSENDATPERIKKRERKYNDQYQYDVLEDG